MPEGRKIYCVCGKYMGEIRDATLRKGLMYLCPTCDKKRRAAEVAERFRPQSNPVGDFMEAVFGKGRGGNHGAS